MLNNHQKEKKFIYDPGYDKAYVGMDRHGIPGKATETYPDPGFDKAYVGADRHGIPGKTMETYHNPGYDKAYVDADRHGIPGKTIETYHDPGFDRAYTDVDRHGIGASYFPDREKFDTSNREVQEFCKDIILADRIMSKGYKQLELLPEKAVKSIIQQRYLKTINKLESGYYDNYIAKQIAVDLEIISKMLLSGKNLYDKDINISNRLGGLDLRNIIGVLDEYESWMTNYIRIDNL